MLSSVRINILVATTDPTASQPHPDQKNFSIPYICLKLRDFKEGAYKGEVNENARQSQEIDFFFFASPAQVRLARHFASHFLVITDAISNTDKNGIYTLISTCLRDEYSEDCSDRVLFHRVRVYLGLLVHERLHEGSVLL